MTRNTTNAQTGNRSFRTLLTTRAATTLVAAATFTAPALAQWFTNAQKLHDPFALSEAVEMEFDSIRRGYVYLGGIFNAPQIPPPNRRPFMVRMDGNYNPNMTVEYIRPGENMSPPPYTDQLFMTPTDMAATSDLGFIICGRYEEGDEFGGGQLTFGSFILKVDANFQVQWYNQYREINQFNAITEMTNADGTPMYVVCGEDALPGENTLSAIAYGVDFSGNYIWGRAVWGDKFGIRGFARYADVIPYDGMTVALTGNANDATFTGYSERDALVSKIDIFGNIVFNRIYGDSLFNTGGNIFGILESGASLTLDSGTGDLVVAGNVGTRCVNACGPVSYDDLLSFRIDPAGNVLWSNQYDLQGFPESAVQIKTALPPTTFVIAADVTTTYRTGTSNPSQDIGLFRLTPTGALAFTTEVFGSNGNEYAAGILQNGSPVNVVAQILGSTWGFNVSYLRPYVIERLNSFRRRCADAPANSTITPHPLPEWDAREQIVDLVVEPKPLVALQIPITQRVICAKIRLGDLNIDGVVSVGDISAFVLALTNPTAYTDQYPEGDLLVADTNEDGVVSVGDISSFVAILTAPPEPDAGSNDNADGTP